MASSCVVWVVHAAAVVGSPAVVVATDGPDLALPDEVFDENPQLEEIAPGHKVRGNSWKHFYFEGEDE